MYSEYVARQCDIMDSLHCFRKYSGPQVIVGDRVLPVNRSLFNKFA